MQTLKAPTAQKYFKHQDIKQKEFSLRVGDMSSFVFCKFEIVIFRIVHCQVITENIPFAFLYVLSIDIYIRCGRVSIHIVIVQSSANILS